VEAKPVRARRSQRSGGVQSGSGGITEPREALRKMVCGEETVSNMMVHGTDIAFPNSKEDGKVHKWLL